MLQTVYNASFNRSLSRYGVKTAAPSAAAASLGQKAMGWGKGLLDGGINMAVGRMRNPAEGISHLVSGDAFRRGGAVREALWPTIHNAPHMLNGSLMPPDKLHQRAGKWLWRGLGVGLPAMAIGGAALGQGDPNEGTMTNVLSTAGREAGNLVGFGMGGMVGAHFGGGAGERLGRGVGHLLGSKPRPQLAQEQFAAQQAPLQEEIPYQPYGQVSSY